MEIKHGTTYSEAHRCRRANKGYCNLCKPVIAAYCKEHHAKHKEVINQRRRIRRKERGYPDSNKKRAIRFGAIREKYTRGQILERDGSNCHLCGGEINLDAPHIVGEPGWETYPHIDHVIPLSLGGSDTLDNVKIAHAKCNLDKGAKVL